MVVSSSVGMGIETLLAMYQDQSSVHQLDQSSSWAVVLAAGDGRRLRPVTRMLYGTDLPKQFAALNSDRTLLQQTMDRLRPLVRPEHTMVVVADDRDALAKAQLALEHPDCRGLCRKFLDASPETHAPSNHVVHVLR
jgi:hypothetical protein